MLARVPESQDAARASASAPSAVTEVLRLTGPAVLTTLLQTMAFLADRIMLARHSEVALGSMQISGAIMWSVFSVFFGAMVGTVALVARRVGAGELERARVVARSALRLAGIIGLVVGLVGSLAAGFIAHAMAPKPCAWAF
jgi:Na+-driven multidrug efflux pump